MFRLAEIGYIFYMQDRIAHTTLVNEYWLEREIVQWDRQVWWNKRPWAVSVPLSDARLHQSQSHVHIQSKLL